MASKIRARHILLDSRDQARLVRERIKSGKSFEEMAREHSEGPTAEKGGDLGWFARGKMVEPFEEAAFDLDVGEISEPVKTEFGWHIIKKEDEE